YEFVPSPTAAVIDLVLEGQNTDLVNALANFGPVTVVTRTTALLSARKRVFLTPEGASALPAIADAVPTTELQRIDTRLHKLLDPLGRRIATDIYYRDQDKSRAGARNLAVDKLTRALDQAADRMVARTNQKTLPE